MLDIPPISISVYHLSGVDGCKFRKVNAFGIV